MIKKVLLIIFLTFSFAEAQTPNENYIDALIKRAVAEKVYEERVWLVLGHYKDTLFRPIHSLIDDPKFFLSPMGKENPQAELEATLKSLFNNNLSTDNDSNHPICKYPARKVWLTERLNIDPELFPKKDCQFFKEVEKKVDPQSITLVFPFMYINRPASMFGHTLLRINNSYNDPLLSYAVTYAADMPPGVNTFIYSVKGLFGGYPGYFSIKKYYETLFTYSNIDRRDVWEYDLNFTKAETQMLFYHLWEMVDIYSDYWFFDENCSYNLLFLLEAARPTLNLTTSVLWEAPPDTVKLVFKEGLVTKTDYRPSHIQIIENIARLMPEPTIDLARNVGENREPVSVITKNDTYSQRLKVSMLDLAIETMRYNYVGKNLNEEELQTYRTLSLDLLSARAKYGVKSDNKVAEPSSPHLGHDIFSVKMGVGFTNNQFYSTVGFRLGFHSFYDIDAGYTPMSQIMVLDTNINWNSVTGDFYVPEVTFISVGAYSPMTKIFKPISWKVDFAAEYKDFKNGKKFTPYLNGAVGATFKFFDTGYVWIMGDLNVSFSNGYRTVAGLALGADGGVSYSFKWGKIIGAGYYRNYLLDGFGHETGVSGSYVFPVTRNNTLTLKCERKMSWDIYTTNISLDWRVYF